jgi:hypothetical protein
MDNYRSPSKQWLYLNEDYSIADTCYVLKHILPLANSANISIDQNAFIAQAIDDLHRRFNKNGTLGVQLSRLVPNTIWGVSALADACQLLPERRSVYSASLESAKIFLRNEIGKADFLTRVRLADVATLLDAAHALDNVRLNSERLDLLLRARHLAGQSQDYPMEMLKALPAGIRQHYGDAYVFTLTAGREDRQEIRTGMRWYRVLRRDMWVQWIVALVIGIILTLLGLL